MDRVTRTYVHKIDAPPEDVFPMLCPVRERDYVPGWNAKIIHSASGLAEKGCVFQTPNDDDPPSTWIITQHDRARGFIQFAIVTPQSHASTLEVHVVAAEGGGCEVRFTYTHVGWTERGRRFIEAFTEAAFGTKMSTFERALNAHLRR